MKDFFGAVFPILDVQMFGWDFDSLILKLKLVFQIMTCLIDII